ncbi:MAG TPA: hypothetical protein VGL40_08140 [Bacillota bacterium]
MESAYSPDLSEWFLEHQYDNLFWPWAKTHPNFPPEYIPKFETDILQNEGLCTEVSLPSNYDKAVKTLVKDPYGNPVHDFNGNPIYYWDTTLMPQPTTATMQEALTYRVTAFSDPLSTASLGVDGLKGLLQTYGPLVAGGPLPILLGSSGNPWDSNPDSPYGLGHESYYSMKRACVTVVGYDDLVKNKDDSLGAFKCLGSWGDRVLISGSNLPGGSFYVPYGSLTGQLTWARYFLNKASDRVGSSQAYTARIGVNCKSMRGGLRIKVGVVGKTPVTVWDRPNISSCRDSSHNLAIDVPLPAYAASAWPPGSARWYLEVEDLFGQDVQVTEFTLAKWSLNQHNLSVGRYATKTYKPDAGQLPASKGTSGSKITVYIPTATNPFPVLSVVDPSEKTLVVDQGSFADGTKEITITGSLKKTVVTGGGTNPASGAPLPSYTTLVGIPGAEARLYELDQTACVNLPAQWKLAMKATTAPTGTFAFKLTPGAGRHIYGVAYTGGGEDVQLSSQCIVVGTPMSGKPPRLYLDLPSLDNLPQLTPGSGQWYLPGLGP